MLRQSLRRSTNSTSTKNANNNANNNAIVDLTNDSSSDVDSIDVDSNNNNAVAHNPTPSPPWSNMVTYNIHQQLSTFPTGPTGKKRTDLSAEQHRQSIALLYQRLYYHNNTQLNGLGGAIPSIAKVLAVHPSTVSMVVKECKAVFDQGDKYNAS